MNKKNHEITAILLATVSIFIFLSLIQFKASYTRNPVEVQKQFGGQWLTTDFQAGDLLIFTMHTMHCSLDNQSPNNRIRLSIDTRYQPDSDEADERWIGENPIAHSKAAKR